MGKLVVTGSSAWMNLTILAVAFAAGYGCSSGPTKSQSDCDAIANEIRTAAASRGLDPSGICSSTNSQVQKDFAQSCASLKDCNDHCCK